MGSVVNVYVEGMEVRAEDSDRDLTHVTVGGWGRFGFGAVVAMADLGFGDDEERDIEDIERGLICWRQDYAVIMKLMYIKSFLIIKKNTN